MNGAGENHTKMASSCLSLSLLLLIIISTAVNSSSADDSASDTIIHQACQATRFPQTCQSSLQNLPPSSPTPSTILTSAISSSTQNLKTAKSMVQNILTSSSGNLNRTNAAKSCLEILTNSDRRISAALTNGRRKDGRAWMSAALAYQYDCWSALKYVNGTSKVNETMSFLAGLIEQTSNALSILVAYDVYGNDTASWKPPRTERDGFWEPVSGSSSSSSSSAPAFPADTKADVTVCKTNGCDYTKIQAAIDAAPVNQNAKFVIWIKQGVYDEIVRVPFEKRNVVLAGDGMGKTVITGNQNVGIPGVSTYNSATLGVLGDGFVMSGVTVQNTAGPDAHQAVAFRSDSDLSLIQNCEFIGNQDTLYAHSLRQLYKNCRIVGNVDFIFGNSASIFQDCTVLIKPRQLKPEKGANNAVTAQGRTDPAQSTGFVFRNCIINGTDEYLKYYNANPKVHKNYLGRPWKEYSRTVFINCKMEGIVSPDGWMPWSGDFALATLFYGEYGNTGAGADLSSRVKWSSEIPVEHVGAYSPENFIQASELVVT